ncbi:JMY protein, partial [Amia calva]|nr:JMY protein [Amia calva]
MSFTMEDALESGWVAVRPHVFEEKEKHKFVFIVAWNEVEGKFAITCHNRTVQRRSVPRDPAAAQATDGPACPAPGLDEEDKAKTSRGPATEKAGGASPAKVRSSPLKAEGANAEDLESGAREDCSWAGLFSFQDLRAVHLQLCSVNSALEPCLPAFPEEPSGMWTVLFGPPEVTQREMDALCCELQVYLGHSLDTCGWKILSQVLFTESGDPEEYYESLSELRRKGYEEALQRAKRRLQEHLEQHKTMERMVDLLEIYQAEDEAYGSLVEATTELYQYLLQPFRDMRELAMLRRQQIKISMENDYLGPRRIESLKKEDSDWQRKAHMAVLSIQDFTVKYFEITARAQKALFDRMRVDQKKFGKAAWAVAVQRMEKLQYAVSKETLQLMRAKEICLEQKKHALREEMQSLQGGEEAMARLDQLEGEYYELQLQLYEIQFEILKCEELLLTAQLESIKRQMIERQDEVVYYDTYESMDAMLATEDMAGSVHPQKEDFLKLQQRIRQLEARRGRISAKKAYLRNKKEICIVNHNEKMQQRQGSQEDFTSDHALQLKEEQLQLEEERKSTWVSQERQKTLDRLRSFKQRHPGQVILKSTRLRLAYTRRKSTSTWSPSGGSSQPQSLAASVQTEESRLPGVSALSEQPLAVPPGQTEPVSLPPGGTAFPPTLAASPPLSLPDGSPDRQPRVELKDGAKGPGAPQFFDSSQLVSARMKLKKTAAMEASQRRRVSSPMDEVLASLKRGSFHLRKVEQRALPPSPDEDDSNNILAQIRKGVKLKKVQRQEMRDSLGELPDSTDPLTRSIHEALRRIKEASPESESEDEGLPCADWES